MTISLSSRLAISPAISISKPVVTPSCTDSKGGYDASVPTSSLSLYMVSSPLPALSHPAAIPAYTITASTIITRTASVPFFFLIISFKIILTVYSLLKAMKIVVENKKKSSYYLHHCLF